MHSQHGPRMLPMNGQWLGTYESAEGGGTMLVNIDERETYFQGIAYAHPHNKALPSSAATFRTPNKEKTLKFRTDALMPIDPATATVISWEEIKGRFGGDVAFSKFADVTVSFDGAQLAFAWTTDLGFGGNCVLPRSKAGEPSELEAEQKTWADFKSYVADLKGKRYLFRGQGKPHRLRTSFHRTGRADLVRFRAEDLEALRKHLSAKTRHVFNFEVPDEFGAF